MTSPAVQGWGGKWDNLYKNLAPSHLKLKTLGSEIEALGLGFMNLVAQSSQPPNKHIYLVTHSMSPLHSRTMTPKFPSTPMPHSQPNVIQ